MVRTLAFLALLSIWMAVPAFATDGDLVSLETREDKIIVTWKLCDGATGGATKQCAVLDIQQKVTGGPQLPAWPDSIAIAFRTATACSGATTVMPQVSDDLLLDPRYDLESAPLAKPASSLGDASEQPAKAWRYYTAAIGTGTDCTDVEVWLKAAYKKN
jgi:hypothetical protein